MSTQKTPTTKPAAHTPTPWRAAKSPNVYGPKGEYVAYAVENEADRELIARAVNAHAEMVAVNAELVGIARELVRLFDAGIRPQIVVGAHREEQDFYAVVSNARAVLARAEAMTKEGGL